LGNYTLDSRAILCDILRIRRAGHEQNNHFNFRVLVFVLVGLDAADETLIDFDNAAKLLEVRSVSLWPCHQSWLIGFKDVTAPTNVRTMIAAAIPASGVGNTLPVIMPENDDTTWYRSNGQRL
jgi:hypothetical protein